MLHEDQILEATDKLHLSGALKVFNLELLGPVFHVHVDLDVHRSCRLLRIYDCETCSIADPYNYDCFGKPWIDIPCDVLNLNVGKHVYALEFVNLVTNDTYYQYFNYVIQSDNPCKPYIYMDRTK